MNAGGASRHLGIAGAVDWPWAFVTGIVGASGGILGAALTRQPPVGSAVAGAILGLVDPSFTPDGAAGAISMGLTSGGSDLTAMGTEHYLAEFPYLGTPHSGYFAPSTTE